MAPSSCYVAVISTFTDLEAMALRAISSETRALATALERQLEVAEVCERKNSGGGFFTTITVADDACAIDGPSVLGYATQARISGLKHGFGFVLSIEVGRLHMLEGFT